MSAWAVACLRCTRPDRVQRRVRGSGTHLGRAADSVREKSVASSSGSITVTGTPDGPDSCISRVRIAIIGGRAVRLLHDAIGPRNRGRDDFWRTRVLSPKRPSAMLERHEKDCARGRAPHREVTCAPGSANRGILKPYKPHPRFSYV